MNRKGFLDMNTIVGIVLVLVVVLFGTIALFGLLDTQVTSLNNPVAIFSVIYFIFIASVIGIVYLYNSEIFETTLEHALAIIMILVFSASIATAVGTLKDTYDKSMYITASDLLKEYTNNINELSTNLNLIQTNNKILESKITKKNLELEAIKNASTITEPIIENITQEEILAPPEEIVIPTVIEQYREYEYEEEYEDDD